MALAHLLDALWLFMLYFSGVQLVPLDQSQFSGAMVRIPSRDLTELEPDWEIDPAGLVIMDKLGTPRTVLTACKTSLKQPWPAWCRRQTALHRSSFSNANDHCCSELCS